MNGFISISIVNHSLIERRDFFLGVINLDAHVKQINGFEKDKRWRQAKKARWKIQNGVGESDFLF